MRTTDILEQMRHAREQSGLDLIALESRTRVRVHLLDAVENGRFEELPRGVYARAVIKAYASAVGIDPNRAVTAIAPLLPEAEDPLDGIARVRGFERAATAHAAAPAPHSQASTTEAASDAAPSPVPANSAPRAIPDVAWRSAATAIDGLILVAMQLILLQLTAGAAGVSVTELLEFAMPAMLMLFVFIAGMYFLVLAGIAGSTAGSRLLHLDVETEHQSRVSVSDMARRGGDVAVRELSILVDVLLPLLDARAPGGKFGPPRSETPWASRAAAR